MTNTKQPTVRAINDWIQRDRYAYVYREGQPTARIIRAKSIKGVLQGYVLGTGKWEVIPADAHIELSRG